MSATLSEDGRYRYLLTRTWPQPLDGDPYVSRILFVMLNPSTADARFDDPTIRRCVGFAQRWGYTDLTVANLYAYRATSPNDLWRADDPVGPLNNGYLRRAAREAGLIVCAWGVHGLRDGRGAAVLRMLRDEPRRHPGHLYCLGLTSGGEPRHPLYVRGDTELVPL